MSNFLKTIDILNAVKVVLEAIPFPETTTGEKLFEVVNFHVNKRLKEALRDLVIVKQRVAILVPNGDRYENLPDGKLIHSTRRTSFDLLIADRSWTKGGHEAVFGGAQNLGIFAMKDIVVDYLIDNPIAIAGVLLEPTEGSAVEIADTDLKDSPGRECFVLNFEIDAGSSVITRSASRF